MPLSLFQVLRLSFVPALALTITLPATAAQEIAYVNARLVDPKTRTVSRGVILVRDGHITSVAPSLAPGFRGTSVDLGGGWVIPGLVDAHAHSYGNVALTGQLQLLGPAGVARVNLYSGVLAFLDLFSDEDSVFTARDRQRTEGLPGARIFAAGPCFTAPKGHCTEYGTPTRTIASPADAERELAALAPKRPDVVKIIYDHRVYPGLTLPTVDLPTLRAFLTAARQRGIPSVVHVGTWDDLRDAVEAGATAVTHTPPGPVPRDLPALMAEHGTWHIPTLAIQSEMARLADDPSILDDPLTVSVVGDQVRASFRALPDTLPMVRILLDMHRAAARDNPPAVRAIAAAGVPILAGTDGGALPGFHGASLHRELEMLVAAGLSPWDALRAATTNPAAFLRQPWGLGVGDEASFVVLGASPIEDIRNTRSIREVVLRGERIARDRLLPPR